jgi:hypothetical protein
VGGTHHGLWQQHRDATDRMNAVLDPDSEPAAVNCRQRRARHHRQKAFPMLRGALGGTRTPNLLIRRCGRRIDNVERPLFSRVSCGRGLLRTPFDDWAAVNCCRQLCGLMRAPSFATAPSRVPRALPFKRCRQFSPILPYPATA